MPISAWSKVSTGEQRTVCAKRAEPRLSPRSLRTVSTKSTSYVSLCKNGRRLCVLSVCPSASTLLPRSPPRHAHPGVRSALGLARQGTGLWLRRRPATNLPRSCPARQSCRAQQHCTIAHTRAQAFHAPQSPFIHWYNYRSTHSTHTVGNKALHQTSSRS